MVRVKNMVAVDHTIVLWLSSNAKDNLLNDNLLNDFE